MPLLTWIKRHPDRADSIHDALDEQGVRYFCNADGTDFTVIIPHPALWIYGVGRGTTLDEAATQARANLTERTR
jgi:hypothetical protein